MILSFWLERFAVLSSVLHFDLENYVALAKYTLSQIKNPPLIEAGSLLYGIAGTDIPCG